MVTGMRDISLIFVTQLVTIALNLILHSALAWFLGPSGRGSYAVCMVFLILFSTLCAVGINGAIGYFIASNRMSLSRGVSAAMFLGLVSGLVGISIGFVLIHLPIAFFTRASRLSFVIVLVWMPLQIWKLSLLSAFAAIKEFGENAVCLVTELTVQIIGIVTLVLVFKAGVEGAVISGALGTAASVSIGLLLFHGRHKVEWIMTTLSDIRQLTHYGLRYSLAELTQLLHIQAGPIFLAMFASASEIGIFAVGFGLVSRATLIPDAVGSAINPRVAADYRGRPELVGQSARIVGMLCFVILLITSLLAREIVSCLFSSRFLTAVPIIWLLLPGVAVRCATKLFVPYLNGTNRPGIQSWATVAALATDVTALIVLYPKLGLLGAGIAMCSSYIVNSLILAIAFHKFSGLSFSESWFLRGDDWARIKEGLFYLQVRLCKPIPKNV